MWFRNPIVCNVMMGWCKQAATKCCDKIVPHQKLIPYKFAQLWWKLAILSITLIMVFLAQFMQLVKYILLHSDSLNYDETWAIKSHIVINSWTSIPMKSWIISTSRLLTDRHLFRNKCSYIFWHTFTCTKNWLKLLGIWSIPVYSQAIV